MFIRSGPCHLSSLKQCSGDLIFLWGQLVYLVMKKINISEFCIVTLLMSQILQMWVWLYSPKLHSAPLKAPTTVSPSVQKSLGAVVLLALRVAGIKFKMSVHLQKKNPEDQTLNTCLCAFFFNWMWVKNEQNSQNQSCNRSKQNHPLWPATAVLCCIWILQTATCWEFYLSVLTGEDVCAWECVHTCAHTPGPGFFPSSVFMWICVTLSCHITLNLFPFSQPLFFFIFLLTLIPQNKPQ